MVRVGRMGFSKCFSNCLKLYIAYKLLLVAPWDIYAT